MNTKITFYPVHNGDCNLLEFADGSKAMIDCNFRNDAENEDNDMFDVIGDLLANKLTSKKKGLPYLNAFVLTHPDQDHCRGFMNKFCLKSPNEISDTDKTNKLILM